MSLWQYHKDVPNDNITDYGTFRFNAIITGKTPAAGNTKDAEISVPWEYLSNFLRILEMPLISCEMCLQLH